MAQYKTVLQEAQDDFVEKRSRFIGYARPVSTEAEALAFIAEKKSKHWDASHNVYAYILRDGGVMRYSDDGEPQGTAGIPVLDVLQKSGVTDVVVVATRYFGGILLGGGGLVRAYSHTASIALQAAGIVTMRECLMLEVLCDYGQYGRAAALVPECGGAGSCAQPPAQDEYPVCGAAGKPWTDGILREHALPRAAGEEPGVCTETLY